MANTKAANVWYIDTTGDIDAVVNISHIKFYRTTGSGTVEIRKKGQTQLIWDFTGSSNIFEDVEIRSNTGLSFVVSGTGTRIYLYEKINTTY